ncbi:MAG TPA: hypothetical protein VGF96_11090 [Terracidiphilus sp.]|jgi:hypothetical protein
MAKQSGEQYQDGPAKMPMRLPGTYRMSSLLWQAGNPHTARTRFHPRSRLGNNDFNDDFNNDFNESFIRITSSTEMH